MHDLHAAKNFRNGLILVIGASLPQRARALSSLEFERTLFLKNRGGIHIRIPANMIKLPEAEKLGPPFELLLHNDRLSDVLTEYRQKFRPIFDSGNALFPSVLAQGQSIREARIGNLAANMTQKAFGIRIPIHRLRDSVATEAAEEMESGYLVSSILLGHKDVVTTGYYDHSSGLKATRAYGDFIRAKRSAPTDLML